VNKELGLSMLYILQDLSRRISALEADDEGQDDGADCRKMIRELEKEINQC